MRNSEVHDYVRSARSSFYYPMLAVPRAKREAILMIYAFCRYTDDLVDSERAVHRARTRLSEWQEEVRKAFHNQSAHEFLNALVRTAKAFTIPVDLFLELIRGIEMDLYKHRYRTFDELYEYCYRVASTVGLMIIRILGKDEAAARAFAVNTGIALQLTNIIRDISADHRKGRIYIPAEDFRRFGLGESDLSGSISSDALRPFLMHQCHRAREYYKAADGWYDQCRSPVLFPARAMQNVYRVILDRMESRPSGVLEGSVSLSFPHKVAIVCRTWWDERSRG